MDDWAKTLISTVAGFSAGLLAEPIKFWIAVKLRKGQVRTAIYEDMARLAFVFKTLSDITCSSSYLGETIAGKYLGETVAGAVSQAQRTIEIVKKAEERRNWREVLPRYISLEVFNYYHSSEKAVFYRLPEAVIMYRFYQDLRKVLPFEHGLRQALTDVQALRLFLETELDAGGLDRKQWEYHYETKHDGELQRRSRMVEDLQMSLLS
jgi:hypothetical protein